LTIGASLYSNNFVFDPETAAVDVDANGFNNSNTGDFYYSDPEKKYRVWGDQLETGLLDGEYCLKFNGNTTGFFQVDGRFSAVELEWVGTSGIIHGTFGINGALSYGINEAFSGIEKKTVFTNAGPGWHSFNFSVGASFINVGIRKINFYELDASIGVSTGGLAQYKTIEDQAERNCSKCNADAVGYLSTNLC